MPIVYTQGDILESDADMLVNPVNCVGVMGAGLAKQFAKRYPTLVQPYKTACEFGGVAIGAERNRLFDFYVEGKCIVCFPTKQHWHDNSTLLIIEKSLITLRGWLLDEHEWQTSVALPPIGCGLGGLDWKNVKPLVEKHLGDLPNMVYVYEPKRS